MSTPEQSTLATSMVIPATSSDDAAATDAETSLAYSTETPPPAPERTPEEIEAELVARRAQLAADIEQLTQRVAPEVLQAQAKAISNQAQESFRAAASEASEHARGVVESLREHAANGTLGELAADTVRSCKESAQRLLDDAREGDPRSLAVVTSAAVCLVSLSFYALGKAMRR